MDGAALIAEKLKEIQIIINGYVYSITNICLLKFSTDLGSYILVADCDKYNKQIDINTVALLLQNKNNNRIYYLDNTHILQIVSIINTFKSISIKGCINKTNKTFVYVSKHQFENALLNPTMLEQP